MPQLDLDRLQALLRTRAFGRDVSHQASLDTTMRRAAERAAEGAPEGAVALADEQTAGRGRRERSWVSPPGVNVYCTVVLRPAIDHLRYLPVIAPLAVCLAIEETTRLLPRIKWPNDVLIDGRKVCGILIQTEVAGDDLRYALLGIGINCNLDPSAHEEIRHIATSLRDQLGHDVSREEVLAAMLNRLEALYDAVRRGDIVSMDWKQRLDTLGRPVRVETPGGATEVGTAVDADSDGALILRRDDGSHVRVESGEVLAR